MFSAEVSDKHIPKDDFFEVGSVDERVFLKALTEREIHVFKGKLYRRSGIAVSGKRHADAGCGDVFKFNLQQRLVVLPRFIAGIVEMQKTVSIVYGAVTDDDVGCGVADGNRVVSWFYHLFELHM